MSHSSHGSSDQRPAPKRRLNRFEHNDANDETGKEELNSCAMCLARPLVPRTATREQR